MFCNEYDLLELRLSEHYDHVDQFVIVECDRTYTGMFKGFNLESNKDRYAKWWDKINYIKIDNCPESPANNAWNNEYWQRDHMALGWDSVQPEDVLIVSDLDEIIRPEALEYIRNTNYSYYALMAPVFYFKLNYMDTSGHYAPWAKAYRGYKGQPSKMRDMQDVPGGTRICIHHAGWHFSWMGNEEFIRNKLKSFAHTEYNHAHILDAVNIEKHIAAGTDHIRPSTTWGKVKLDNYFPKTILNNLDKYSKYIIEIDTDKTVQTYFSQSILQTQ